MNLNLKIGLKLYTTNTHLIHAARAIYDEGLFQYIELYMMPGTYAETKSEWSKVDIPKIIHAPHALDGLNLSLRQQRDHNQKLLSEVGLAADELNAQYIILHSGISGTIDETIIQANALPYEHLLIENKPMVGVNGESCVGWSPAEISKALQSGTFHGMVLDFGHAICAANANGKPAIEYVREFLTFNPTMFHLSDGDIASKKDSHLNFGKGTFPLSQLLGLIPPNAYLTIEAPRHDPETLDEFIMDIKILSGFLSISA